MISQHFRFNAGLLLKPAPAKEKVKCFFVLVLVDQETKEGKHGKRYYRQKVV